MAKQPKSQLTTPSAVHSYLHSPVHLVRKNGIHPYVKRLTPAAHKAASP